MPGKAYLKGLAINNALGQRDGMATKNYNLAILRLQPGAKAEAHAEHAVTARELYAEVGLDRDVADARRANRDIGATDKA